MTLESFFEIRNSPSRISSKFFSDTTLRQSFLAPHPQVTTCILSFVMKVSILSFGSYALSLLSCSLVHSFPTAENFAKLIRHNALGGPMASSEGLHEGLLHLREKRLFFDPMITPIDGSFFCQDPIFLLISDSDWQARFPSAELRKRRPERPLSWTQRACQSWLHLS